MAAVTAATGAASDPDPLVAASAATAEASEGLDGRRPDLAVVFCGAAHIHAADAVATLVRERSAARHLLGMTVGGVVSGAREYEHGQAIGIWAATLPGADLTPLRYDPPREEAPRGGEDPAGWIPPPEGSDLILLADPFSFPGGGYCSWLGQARPGTTVSGGLASAAGHSGGNRLILDDAVLDSGAVAMAVGGAVRLRTLVSQGCRPVGEDYVVTRAESNLVLELAGQPPVERLRALYAGAGESDRALLREGLHIGTVIDEYRDTFERGDFLVRAVLGAERDGGGIAVGDEVRVGQTVRFHVRDADSADADLRLLLGEFAGGGRPPAALLFTCNGRGARLFGAPHHDAEAVRHALGDVALGGCFCAGEFGPVGGRSFLHGFTASLVAFEPSVERGA